MVNLNPFNITGVEAVVASLGWAVSAGFMVWCCSKAASSMTVTICACVKDSVVAWANAYASTYEDS